MDRRVIFEPVGWRIVAAASAAALLIGAPGHSRPAVGWWISFPASAHAAPADAVTVAGTIECLPRHAGPGTFECVIGLRDIHGRHYGLSNPAGRDLLTGTVSVGQRVRITGLIAPGQAGAHDLVGTIQVQSISPIDGKE